MAKDDYEGAIKKLLKAQRRPLPIFRISKKTNISWSTTRKYLKKMSIEGTVKKKQKVKKHYMKCHISGSRLCSERGDFD